MEHRKAVIRPMHLASVVAQEAAFTDDDVVAIVKELVAKPELPLVRIAAKAILFDRAPDQDALFGLIGPAVWVDEELGPAAERIVSHGVRIATSLPLEDRRLRRGALLERLVYTLVAARRPGRTYREHEVRLTHAPRCRRGWSRRKEVVADGATFEVYECKSDGMFDIGDIDELSDIGTTAKAEGTDARPTIAAFASTEKIRNLARGWRLTEPIYYVPTDNLLDLRSGPSAHPVRPLSS